ncbi:MAG: TetR/AcrR family transcriptional regulator [Pseudomonadota bacterium]
MNRAKIRAAAEAIIRKEGIEKLTMRRLADVAGVSLRTPYNLFGSKTEVLIALLDGAQFDPLQNSPARENQSALAALMGALDHAEAAFEEDEAYFRVVFREIMISDPLEAQATAIDGVLAIGQAFAVQALNARELKEGTDAKELGRHLGIQLTAILGMWATGFFSNKESMRQTRRGWAGVLLNHCTQTTRPMIEAIYRASEGAEEPVS